MGKKRKHSKFSINAHHLFFHLFRHKGCEVEWQWDKHFTTYFNASTTLSRRVDHAGFQVCLEICWLSFSFNIYDYRHWDYYENRWYTDDEERELT